MKKLTSDPKLPQYDNAEWEKIDYHYLNIVYCVCGKGEDCDCREKAEKGK